MVSCPTCSDPFDTEQGMKSHHTQVHGESIAGVRLTCDTCGGEYRVDPCEASESRFCSWECRKESFPDNVEKECEWCGDSFLVWEYESHRRRFCTRECYGDWSSENIVGEDHARWQGGGADYEYGREWQEIRQNILQRDQYRCQECDLESYKCRIEYGRGLDVHHIKPLREFDSPDEANVPENLITLCIICHRKQEDNFQR